MAGAGKKTFTAGEILTASDTNTYLMEQTVMNFAGTAARASAIPTPSTGMTTYIGTTGTASIPQIETYTGSQWQTPYGQTLLANVSFTAATSVIVDNVFTSAYDSYYLVVTARNTSANDVGLAFQFRNAGATIAGTAYQRNAIQSYLTAISASGTNGGAFWQMGVASQVNVSQTTATLSNASKALPKAFEYHNCHAQAGATLDTYYGFGSNTTSTAYDGMILVNNGSGAITGTLRIYGLRNS
jgi:hypothetical protein